MALANTTFGVIMATIDSSIMLIALPDIFEGIHLDPLRPGNSFYLLWLILSFLVVSSVLVVSFGRLGDMFGRVKMYNLGFAIYTVTSLILTVDWLHGQPGALYLVVGRVFQGVGAAFLVANSSAILTDAFPEDQRGLALGINNVAAISGVFIGLVLGGILARSTGAWCSWCRCRSGWPGRCGLTTNCARPLDASRRRSTGPGTSLSLWASSR